MSGKFESTVGGEYIIDALARAARRGERLEFRHNNFTCETWRRR